MKVLIQLRVDAHNKYGGDVLHAEKTAESLRRLGVSVDVPSELQPSLEKYDLVHLFNMDWVRDPYIQALNAKAQNKPIVLSPLHHSFSEIDEFERRERYDFRRLINPIFRSYASREYLKNIYRAFVELDTRKWAGTFLQWRVGLRKQYLELLGMSDLVLPNTHLEEEELLREFKVKVTTSIVPAGVDTSFAQATPDWFYANYPEISSRVGSKFALMVGRIEPRKNQLRVMRSLKETEVPLLLVGKFNWHHPEYIWRIKRELKKNAKIIHIESVPHDKIGSVFAASTCHILASWFETTGLVNLEAALTGANVVTTSKGFGKEYVKNFADYIEPGDEDSIRQGVLKSMSTPFDEAFRQHILLNYTWNKVGELTEKAYAEVLNFR